MFTNFFFELRQTGVPVTLLEYLTFLESMKKNVANFDIDRFYYLARCCLVKDERNIDKFDKVFGSIFEGVEFIGQILEADIPEDWLKKLTEKILSPQEMEQIEALGGWEELMKTLKERLAEQKKRHQGGSKMIGTAGTSPFGAYGYNPEGVRIGQDRSRHQRAVKVWDERKYKNLDGNVEIGTRNIKMALRRLRQFAREGHETELDLDNTIQSTANNGGFLDIKLVPERHNSVKVLLLLDVGGSMDFFVKICEELFSAARNEFKDLEYYYFHNMIYEHLWKDNRRRRDKLLSTWDLIHTYPKDYKLIIVGDASMSPYEITYPGGSVEHWNSEPGEVWVERLLNVYDKCIWLNPVQEEAWNFTPSILAIKRLVKGRMFPLTLDGIDEAMQELSR